MRANLYRLLSAALLLLLLAAACVLSSCGAAQSLGNAFNIETNPYKTEIPLDNLGTSALNGKWTINVGNVVLDDPQGVLGFTADDFMNEVNGQSFYFDTGSMLSYNYPFNIDIEDAHLMRVDLYKYRLIASGKVTIETEYGDKTFDADLDIAGTVNEAYTSWQGSGKLTYSEVDTGDITGGISLDFLLTKK